MQKTLLILLFGIPLILTAQTSVVWSEAITVTQTNAYITAPRVVLVSGESIWLLFKNNNQNIRDIWISRMVDTSNLICI